jgi:NADH-quinone oxidoreductase subunit E
MARILSENTLEQIEGLCGHYPSRLAALLPALHLAQRAHGHLPPDVQLDVAEALRVPVTRVHEVVSFYTMFHEQPVGRHCVKICRNLPCQLRGADRLMERAKEELGVDFGETTADGRITLEHDECLASCGTGPMLWCDDTLLENVTEERLVSFLKELA